MRKQPICKTSQTAGEWSHILRPAAHARVQAAAAGRRGLCWMFMGQCCCLHGQPTRLPVSPMEMRTHLGCAQRRRG